MNILIACEFSGIVRDAFIRRGHDAWSCDLLPSEGRAANHIIGDVRKVLKGDLPPGCRSIFSEREPRFIKWDMMIAFPPCTHLAVSGARWFKNKKTEQAEALDFVRLLLDAPIQHIALENPVSVISTAIRKPDQIIQPWMFGHPETKATCLWLKNLPLLEATRIVEGRHARVHREPPSPDRWKRRSRTLQGIAEAMAAQWGREAALPRAA